MADAAVRETDNDAAVSRLSAVRQGYLQDDFAAFFVKRPSTRPPVINIGTFLRTWSIDRLVNAFLAGEGQRQIVSLGAGTDTRFFRIASNATQAARLAKYIEVDFPEATTKKAMTIRKQSKLAELLQEPVALGQGGTALHSARYSLIPGDLKLFATEIAPKLLEVLDLKLPTLFLAECVFTYLDPAHSSTIMHWLSHNFSSAGAMIVMYDPVGLDDNFGKIMVNNLQTRGLSLLGAPVNRSLAAIEARLLQHGFAHAVAEDIRSIRKLRLGIDEERRLFALEMLDEVEELNLLTSHYCVAWACTTSNDTASTQLAPRIVSALE